MLGEKVLWNLELFLKLKFFVVGVFVAVNRSLKSLLFQKKKKKCSNPNSIFLGFSLSRKVLKLGTLNLLNSLGNLL